LRQFISFTIVSTKLLFRSKETVLWNILFPVLLFLIYVTVFSGMYGEQISKPQAVADNLAKILAITFMSGGIFNLGISVAVLKEKGILKRYKVTPVRSITIVLGLIIRQAFLMILITICLFVLSLTVFSAELKGTVIDWIIISFIGIFVFTSLGFIVAGIAKTNQGAAGIANLFFMPMLFLSGSAIPAFLFPAWLTKVSNLLPATHLNNLLSSVLFGGNSLASNMTSILALLGFGVCFVIIAAFLNRWN
jgi:ABC-2 type transport system permease protein